MFIIDQLGNVVNEIYFKAKTRLYVPLLVCIAGGRASPSPGEGSVC